MNASSQTELLSAYGFDPQRLAELLEIMGSEHEVRSLFEFFKADFSQVCVEIAAFLNEGDLAKVQKRLHALKGAASNLGLSQISATAAVFETALANGENCRAEQLALQQSWSVFTQAQ
jgi:HPt (histidine-containing phosphotransfer) domain-containing protein